MCRLFGLHAGGGPVRASFWLLDAPDSLAAQSRRNPDGAGIGTFDESGRPVIDKQPIAAWEDTDFAAGARDLRSTVFVAHVRYASTGGHTPQNTHPFEQDGRLFAHNGAFEGLDALDARLAELGVGELVLGETDSERLFALITAETRRAGGEADAGIVAALDWICDHLPVYALNFVLTTPTDLWALRYPAANELHLLSHGVDAAGRRLDSRTDRIHARSEDLAGKRWVIVASEPMDAEPGWTSIASGELVHVDSDLTISSTTVRTTPPVHQLTHADLTGPAAQSQHPSVA